MMNSGLIRLLLQSSGPCHRCSNSIIHIQPQRLIINTTSNPEGFFRCYSSKTAVSKSSLATASQGDKNAAPYEIQSKDGIQLQSLANNNNTPSVIKKRRKKNPIIRVHEDDLEGYAILQSKLPLLDRRGEAQSHYLRAFAPEKRNSADVLALMHGDIDLRTKSIKRWWSSLEAEAEIKNQAYNPKRNSVLGNDLAAAHFIVFRKGRVRFKDQTDWIETYRKDAKRNDKEEDLPVMTYNLCTLPVNYDPRFRLEAIDATGVSIRYEGLLNFQNLSFVKWVSFKDSPLIDDWCMDRIVRLFSEKLEFMDLSGCLRVTDKGIGALVRCKQLKTLVVENMSHVKDLEIVCSLLEDHNPGLTVIGVDYVKKTEELRKEGEELERKAKEKEAALEANTITVEPKHGPGPDPFISSMETERQDYTKSSQL